MRQLSTAELIELGRRFGIEVDGTEADALREAVNEMLTPLGTLEEMPLRGQNTDSDPGSRTWHRAEDPHNAVAFECEVPPTQDANDRLTGTTAGVKDVIAVAGIPMECGSAVMRGFVPSIDATVVERLRAASAIVAAKTTLDEFAGSARGTTGTDGPVRNPHDPERTAGGSSGGSAAAVASHVVDVALGTDTGGSIRIPAAFCGVVGMKPTYGLVPLSGVVENTYTQDHVGPITSDVAATARTLKAIAGKDPGDPASMAAAGHDDYRLGEYVDAATNPPDISELSLCVLEEGIGEGVADSIVDRTDAALDVLADAGASIRRTSVEWFHHSLAIKNILSFIELAAHWRDGGAPYRRGGRVDEGYQVAFTHRTTTASGELSQFYRSKLLAGAQLVEAHGGRHYVRAQAAREVLSDSLTEALEDVDALVIPTTPDVAPPIEDADDPGFDYARNTRIANVTRLPAITLPNGTIDGLPIGIQLMGPAFADDRLLAVAASIEAHL